MVTILNNTQANFDAFVYVRLAGRGTTTRMIRVKPGFSKVSPEDLIELKRDNGFQRALDSGAVVVNEGAPKSDKAELVAPKPKKRKKKRADFKDFE